MNKKSVLNRLSSLKAPLKEVGVSQLGLFGSTVRGENTRKSDIDILIDFYADQETYLNFINACSILQSAFGKTVLHIERNS
ncbi:MAG: nucleotidyltransferase domain-containing protein [Bacteroidaceae bacterium]|nr:nucleotidyltransferase domain-containing protein [Bacteroidaceae bacterium]